MISKETLLPKESQGPGLRVLPHKVGRGTVLTALLPGVAGHVLLALLILQQKGALPQQGKE